MFNIKEVQPVFGNDPYNFTCYLINFLNNENIVPPPEEITSEIMKKAFIGDDAECKKILYHALFLIYQLHLAYPLSSLAKKQHDSYIVNIKNAIEKAWLNHEFKNLAIPKEIEESNNISDHLKKLWLSHKASHHPLFDFLEKDAKQEHLYYFFKSDSALNLIFFDLVAYSLIGAQPETRGTISENLWDEIGHGDNVFTHVNLYKDVLSRQNIKLPDNHYIDLYNIDALAGHNAFMIGCVNRQHYYKLLGVMAMTEVLDPPQYEKLVNGCNRLGLIDRDVKYYNEHITIDIKHGDDWLYQVIDTISEKKPESRKEFYLGCMLRLNTAERYYDQLLQKLLSL